MSNDYEDYKNSFYYDDVITITTDYIIGCGGIFRTSEIAGCEESINTSKNEYDNMLIAKGFQIALGFAALLLTYSADFGFFTALISYASIAFFIKKAYDTACVRSHIESNHSDLHLRLKSGEKVYLYTTHSYSQTKKIIKAVGESIKYSNLQ